MSSARQLGEDRTHGEGSTFVSTLTPDLPVRNPNAGCMAYGYKMTRRVRSNDGQSTNT
jgi:hypothetical protein